MLAFDTETAEIREARLAPELACITFSDGNNVDIVHHADPSAQRCAEWLLGQELTTANGAYDLAVLWAYFPDLRDPVWDIVMSGRVHDVQTRQKLMDIGAGCYRRVFRRVAGEENVRPLHYRLSDLHARYFGTFMEKDEWRLRYGELRNLPLSQWPEGAKRYAMYDAVVTSRIHTLQEAEKAKQPHHNLWDEPFQMRADWVLYLMSCWGFRADRKQVEKVIGHIDNEMPELERRLMAANLVRKQKKHGELVFVRSEKIAKAMMYAAVGDKGELTTTGYKKVKAGEMSVSEALRAGYIKIDEEWCEISGYDALVDYYHFRQNQLLRAKLSNIHKAALWGLPIQTSFEVLMETGRTSSRDNRIISNSMALQNPPRKGGLRECFIPRDKFVLIAADFGQAELVSLAQVTYSAFGFSKMRDLLNADMDIHVDFGSQVMAQRANINISYQDASKMRKAKGGYNLDTKELCLWDIEKIVKELKDKNQRNPFITMSDMRQLAKAADFGFPGGLGWASFQSYARKAWGVDLTEDQAKQLKIYWLKHFPEMKEYFRWMGSLMEAGNGSAAIQQFKSLRWRGKCRYTQGCNTLFQGLTADAAKAALVEVSRRCYTVPSSALYGCRPLLFVHDEIIAEAPEEQAPEAAKEMEHVMVEVYSRYTPDVKITADAHLMTRWSKDAEALFDERGRLLPWSPPQDEDEQWEKDLVMAA